jgi:hypothetical protein
LILCAGGELVPYLFFTVIAVAIAAFASLKFSLSLLACVAIVTTVVKVTATRLIGPVSIGAAARSVAWAVLLPALVLIGLAATYDGKFDVEGVAAVFVLMTLFASFALGFKFSLGATFGASATIATVSTLVSAGLLYLLRPLLF